ncbi:MAG TPA: FAD-dependent oxidoreductase, partial [Anaerolineales bacterium]|nr:FAD-dependent oxidoreductase [Anaerolineales bacterium]
SGASGRSGGGVRQSARATPEMPLANEAVALFPTLSDELGVDIEYVQKGNLRLVESVDHIRPMQVDVTRQQSIGLNVRWVGQADVCEMVPSLSRESVFGASFCVTDGHANPLKLTTGYANAAMRAGAKVITGCEVRGVRQMDSGEAVVETTGGEFRARTVIVTAGAGARALGLALGFDLPLANMRYESLVTEAVPPMFPFMFGVASADLFFRQTRHGSVHFGGGMVEQGNDERTTTKNLQLAAEHIVKLIPGLGQTALVRTWGGLDPSTPDGIPIIDRLNDNVLIAAGFCGHGFAIGPVVGRYLADWAATGEKPAPLDPFRRDRFGALLQTKWTPSGSFEAALATESTQVVGGKHESTASVVLMEPGAPDGDPFLMITSDLCTGCRMCEMACAIHHTRMAQATQLRVRVAYASDASFSPVPCIHCVEAYCKDACPVDALEYNERTRAIEVIDENCIACMLCIPACPYGGITFCEDKGVVIKCDLCGGDPACATYCPTGAIRFRPFTEVMWDRVKANAVAMVKELDFGYR